MRGRSSRPLHLVVQGSKHRSPEYLEIIAVAAEELEVVRDAVFDAAVHAALVGPWQEWSDKQPNGTRFCFDREDLRGAGDACVSVLAELSDQIDVALEALRSDP